MELGRLVVDSMAEEEPAEEAQSEEEAFQMFALGYTALVAVERDRSLGMEFCRRTFLRH